MISILPKIYPDELFFSWIGRFYSISGYRRHQSALRELFGQDNISYNLYYPEGLEYFCSQLPVSFNLTPDYIIEKHTIFPFFRPFLSEKLQKIIINGMKEKGKYHLKDMMGANSGYIFNDNKVKICLDCFDEDIERYGEGYIHRIHQVPGSIICTRHNKFLVQIDVSDAIANKHFIDINNLKNRFNSTIDRKISEEYIKLSQDIDVLLNSNLIDYNHNKIIQKYNNQLTYKNYRTKLGTVHRSELINDLLDFYSSDFLAALSSNLDKDSIYSKSTWIHVITKENRQKVHPLRHLLFIRFLFGSLKDFFEYTVSEKSIKPFDEGPWPCLNRASDHYKMCVVKELILTKNVKSGNPMGIFKCNCGFIYQRNGPDTEDSDRYKYSYIKEYGHIWQDKIRELIEIKGYNASQVGKILHCKGETIVRHARRLGIGKYKSNVHPERYDKLSKLEEHKNNILSFMSKNPTALRKDLCKNLHIAYYFVLRYDRNWFEKNLPQKSNRALNARYEINKQEWHQKDLELSSKIPIIEKQILSENPPIRITKSQFNVRLNYKSLTKTEISSKLPLTCTAIEKAIESTNDFTIRKMDYFAKQLHESGEKVTKTMLSKFTTYKNNSLILEARNEIIRKYNELTICKT